jgi:sugar phosphate isomerase/epimerase
MRVYASSVLLYAYRMQEVFRIVRDLGYDGVEVWHHHLHRTGESTADLLRLARQLDLALSVHALSWDLNFTSDLPRIREESLCLLQDSIDLTARLEAKPVVVHPGRITVPKDDAERYWPWLVEGVNRLAHYAARYGVNLSVEVMEHIPNEFFVTPEDAARLIESVSAPNVSITFDAAHVPWALDPLDYLKRMPRVEHMHLSGTDERRWHLALGEGKRNFSPLLRFAGDHLNVSVAIEGIEYEQTTSLAVRSKAAFEALADRASSMGKGVPMS